jgi:hypothetical protein
MDVQSLILQAFKMLVERDMILFDKITQLQELVTKIQELLPLPPAL